MFNTEEKFLLGRKPIYGFPFIYSWFVYRREGAHRNKCYRLYIFVGITGDYLLTYFLNTIYTYVVL